MEHRRDAAAWGVEREWKDVDGVRRHVSGAAVEAVLDAMGAATRRPSITGAPAFLRPGDALPPGAMRVELEQGGGYRVGRVLPPAIPTGHHSLTLRDGTSRRLVVAPRACPLPSPGFGWSVQLYALRSARSWGMGDLSDLRRLARWSSRHGASLLVVNPLHAPPPGVPQEPSPYYPASRLFLNPLYIDPLAVPGAASDPVVVECAREARRLNADRFIDRDRVLLVKERALRRLWDRFTGDRRFDAYGKRDGPLLDLFATFCAISERHGRSWRSWPPALRRPDSVDVARFARQHEDRVGFFRFEQWLLDEQLRAASQPLHLVQDLAVGFSPDGFDAWLWQDLLARGVTVGAPPDDFATAGQDWSVPPFDPHRLRAAGYAPIVETFRRAMRHGGGIRIDHVMGLFRLWWVPAGGGPAAGAYVNYPADDLLDLLALESRRAGCFVVGEDLGTVGPEVRGALRRRGVLSYRVAWFEPRTPRHYPVQALAALGTHDLPTVAGLWSGADIRDQEAGGCAIRPEAEDAVLRRLRRLSHCGQASGVAEVTESAYAALAAAPSLLVTGSLDDLMLAPRRPNIPGSAGRPNWCIPLPATLDQLTRAALPRRVATRMARRL